MRERAWANSEKFQYWLSVVLRYALVAILLNYAFAKVFGLQFYVPLVTLDAVVRNLTGIQLAFYFFGYSYVYTLFVALSQILGSVLLLSRRTTMLGAALLLPVISNIVVLNFTHDIPVRLPSVCYLLIVLYLLAPDFKRLKALFWDNTRVPARAFPYIPKGKLRRFAKYALVLLIFGANVGVNYYYYVTDLTVTTPLYGGWEVEEYRVNGSPISADSDPTVWKRLYFESDSLVAVKSDDQAKPQWFLSELDSQRHSIHLKAVKSETEIEGTYELRPEGKLIIKASAGSDTVEVMLKRIR